MTKKEKRQKKVGKKKKIRRQERGREAWGSGLPGGSPGANSVAFFILKKHKC